MGFLIVIIILLFTLLLSLGIPDTIACLLIIGLALCYPLILKSIDKIRMNQLYEKLDPESFLKMTEVTKRFYNKSPKTIALINLNFTNGYTALGEYDKTLEILRGININVLSKQDNSLFAYYGNLTSCLYTVGDFDEAEKIFEKEIKNFFSNDIKAMLSKDFLTARRLYHSHEYEHSRNLLDSILHQKNTSLIRLSVLYQLALIDEAEGKTEDALIKYREVAEKGNKLYIAQQARLKLQTV